MTWFNSLSARRFAFLAILFAVAVSCAKVDRGYYDEGAGGSVGGEANEGGKAGSGEAGKGGTEMPGEAGSGGSAGVAGEGGEAGIGGEPSAGAGGALNGTLTVSLAGDGTGVVTSDVPGIDCGKNCSAEFDDGATVVLTASADTNSVFRGWSGGGCSGTGTCSTVIGGLITIKATFAAKVKLSVTLAGDGSGVVKSVPDGLDCGSTCSTLVAAGTSVQLTPTPAANSIFLGWSGGGCTGTAVCTTSVTAATSVTATFAQAVQTLTVTKTGTGTGTVTSAPAGTNCGTTCSQMVNYGTVVTLTATAAAGTGSVFSGWNGGGCTGTGTCAVTVTAATQVAAIFSCAPGTKQFDYSGAIVNYTLPSCVTSVTIDTYGASGGSATYSGTTYAGGLGARMKGTFAVTGGPTFKVLVGQKGIDAADNAQQAGGSGGGGTFVTNPTNSPFVVAGGGGGAIGAGGQYAGVGLNASITTAGTADSANLHPGGVNGNGGTTGNNTSGYHPGTGGGGLLTNGVGNSDGSTTSYGTAYTPGFAFVNGGAGGGVNNCAAATNCIVGRAGGFGGGGSAGYTGGGGGGYSGGASGSWPTVTGTYNGGGGGGGSYNNGTAQTNTAGARVGNGMVIFTY